MARRRLTDAERDARRHADRERIEQAARALLTTDGWQRWIRVRATNGLSRYSLRNQWLIAIECHARGITPTYVAGFRAFLALNRCVRKGETAIRILAPVAVKQRDDARRGDRREARSSSAPCRSSTSAMTDPLPGIEPVPLAPARAADRGRQPPPPDRPAVALGARARLQRRDPRAARRRARAAGATPSAGRSSSPPDPPTARSARSSTSSRTRSASATSSTAASEAEVLVDCVTYIVCSSVGLDVGGESIPYIAGWGEDGALDAIREYAETIDTIARRIEDALDAATARRRRESTQAGLTGRLTRPRRSGLLAAPVSGEPAGGPRRTRTRGAGRRPARPGRGACSPDRTEPTVTAPHAPRRAATRPTSTAATTATSSAPSRAPSTPRAS